MARMETPARNQAGIYGATRATLAGWLGQIRREPQLLLVYLMVVPALVALILSGQHLPPWRYYGAILALSALLALNLVPSDSGRLLDRGSLVIWAYLLAASAALLTAMRLSDGTPFIANILFLLIGQATWSLRLPQALAFAALLLAAFFRLVGGDGGLDRALETLFSLLPAVLFTMVFTFVAVRYGQQTERAENLLRQLRQANVELEAARVQEQELAAAQERVRLARDIHDGLGHHLTVLNVQLQAAEKLLARDPQRAAKAIATSREVAHAALEEVRRSVSALHRSPLDGRPLDEALAALVREFGERAGLAARFQLRGDPVTLPPAAAMTLYRAAQEGLTNTRKHAAASSVLVTLAYEPSAARLTVQDDGGAPAEGAGSGGGFGLVALRERAEQLGGAFSAGPSTEGGFTLTLQVPADAEGRR
jgi:signal transduction histidine kinase